MIHSFSTEFYDLHLHNATGNGVAVLPDPADDVVLGLSSVHASVLADASRQLDAMGWEFTEGDDDHGLSVDAVLPDGRVVVGLYGRDPVCSAALDESASAFDELLALASSR